MDDALLALVKALIQQLPDNPYKLLLVGLFASAFSWSVKKWLVSPQPKDPWWKSALWTLAHVFDKVAVNSEPVAQIRARSTPPPAPDAAPTRQSLPPTTGAVIMLAVVVSLLASATTACAARSPIMREVRAAETAAPTVRAIHDVILNELKADAQHEEALHPTDGPALATALQNLEDRFLPLRKAYAAVAATYVAYLHALQEANAAGNASVPQEAIAAVKVAWNELIAEAERMRVDLPDVSEITRILAGGLKP